MRRPGQLIARPASLIARVALLVGLAAAAPGPALAGRSAAQAPATVVVHDQVVGRGPLLIGANPGLTTAPNWEAWLRDSRMNAAREWANMEEIEPENEDGDYGNGVADESAFLAARVTVLEAPEANGYLTWAGFRFKDVDRRVGTYARIGVTPVVVLRHSGSGSTREANLPPWMANVPRAWPDLWEWWEYCFAVAYHTAGQYGVTRFAIHSEPDRSVQGFTGRAGDYVRLLAHGADAARAGVGAANSALAATIHAPGLAEPTAGRGSYLRTVLSDGGGDVDVVDYHQYGPARDGEYAARAEAVRGLAEAVGAPRPLFVSEYNISRSGERGDVDEPDDALGLAEAQRQLILAGVEGMLVYRFNFPSEFRNLSLVRSGSGSTRALVDETLGYQVFKQFATAVAGGKELLLLEGDDRASWLATRDRERIFLLGIYRGREPLPVEIDLAALGVEGRTAVVRAASADHPNTIIARPTVAGGRLALGLPPASAVLVSLDRAPDSGAPVGLRLEPPTADLDRHRVVQLRAVATLADGGELDVSDRVTWVSSDPATVRVNSTGLAASLASGTAELTASWDDLGSAPATLVVR
jgi:hypothetical protein